MYIVGIDENGFGPKLGPLVVTGTIFKIDDEYNNHNFKKTSLENRVEDSKDIFKQNIRSKAKGEDIVLSYYYLLFKKYPQDADEFLSAIAFPSIFSNAYHCEGIYRKICWHPKLSIPIWERETPSINPQWETSLEEIQSIICCPREFNQELKKNPNKMLVNLSYFERLMNYYQEKYGSNILFLCGKIGGIKDYLKYSNFLNNKHRCQPLNITDDVSSYLSSSLGKISFIKNGDQSEFPIALASIFGKYIREIFIERLNLNFPAEIRNDHYISGYYNHITDSFIKNVLSNYQKLDIPESYLENCFIRKK